MTAKIKVELLGENALTTFQARALLNAAECLLAQLDRAERTDVNSYERRFLTEAANKLSRAKEQAIRQGRQP